MTAIGTTAGEQTRGTSPLTRLWLRSESLRGLTLISPTLAVMFGMMVAPIVYLDPNMMAGILLYAFAAALVGGIDSPHGAVIGGFVVGVLENLLGAFVIGNELKLSVALALIIGVLLVRPSGFFGKVHVTRV